MSDTDLGASTTGRLSRTRAYRPWVPTPDERRPVAIDLVASGLLAVCAVNAFDPAFGGGLWWSVGLVGIAAGLIVAFSTIQFRSSPLTTVLATVIGFFVLGGHAVIDTAIAQFLPGPETPAALYDGITHGWARLLTTVTPVGTVDNLAAIIYLAGFVAAGGALQLARRTRSIWLPLIPPMIAMIAGILVGTHTPASTLLQGAAMGLTAIVWVSLRGARIRPRVHVVGTNRWTRRLTGVVFAGLILGAALLVADVQPLAGSDQRSVLRDRTQPPFDPNDYPSPLAGYPAWRIVHKKIEDANK
ncbi:MAG TPA: hypothetical protein VFN21_11020, partial [Acidimicrobiales bacterium]|nr:hypothetical protein [Acidimicrobiales bacterium]